MTIYSFGTNPDSIGLKADHVVKGKTISYTHRNSTVSWDQDCLGEICSYNEETDYGDTNSVDINNFTLLPGDVVIVKWDISYRTRYLLKQDGINVVVVGQTDDGDNFIV